MNISKLQSAVEAHQPKTILESIGINRLREMIQRLPVVIDRDMDDAEDYLGILDTMKWGDEAQRQHAYRECEHLMRFVVDFKIAGDGGGLDATITPMPPNTTLFAL